MFKKVRSLHSRLLRLEKLYDQIKRQQTFMYQKYYGRVIRRKKTDEGMLRRAKKFIKRMEALEKWRPPNPVGPFK